MAQQAGANYTFKHLSLFLVLSHPGRNLIRLLRNMAGEVAVAPVFWQGEGLGLGLFYNE